MGDQGIRSEHRSAGLEPHSRARGAVVALPGRRAVRPELRHGGRARTADRARGGGEDAALAQDIAAVLRADTLRIYPTDDLAGLETGGAIKNVLAIAAGASDGLGFGHNARAALITRGLAETGRLSAALGGKRETLMGLGGLGDLVLTCTGDLSRNRQVGLRLARGEALASILAALGHVAEGVAATRAARALALHHRLDMPIVDAVHRVLELRVPPADAVRELLRREPRAETE